MRFRHYAGHDWRTLRAQPLAELSGAVGDLGTFLPIVVALTVNHSISLPSTLIFSGLWNILTGLFFGIPLPVQPMKAIAAVAIAGSFSAGQIAAAGIFMGACILLFSVTGILRWFVRVVPIPVVKGIQVGAGLSLVVSAGGTLRDKSFGHHQSWADNYAWAIVGFLGLLVTNVYRRVPYGLILFVLGIVFAIILLAGSSSSHGLPSLSFWIPPVVLPLGSDWAVGILDAGLGQIPLTTLNSIIAVVHLASDLLPDIETPTVTAIGLSVAGMNLIGTWFGSMPVCHGSGGLAAQYRFGARSGGSIIVLGLVKLVVGIFFGNSLVDLLDAFPSSFLAVMVVAAGLELASVGESLNTSGAWDLGGKGANGSASAGGGDGGGSSLPTSESRVSIGEAERKQRWTVMIVTIGLLIGFKNAGVGFVAGMLCHWCYYLPGLVSRTRDRWSQGRIRLPSAGRGQ